ncbi:nucleotidyltransferase family protein [Lutibacter sp. B2]|nr:nucleotidyltransferase family protein [Lutibacter sp. B2]
MDIKSIIISDEISIKEAMFKIDKTSKKILIVADDDNRVLGVITDGDLRRWILKNGDLNKDVSHIMNTNPTLVRIGEEDRALSIMKSKFIDAIPVVDQDNKVVSVVLWNDKTSGTLNKFGEIDIPIIIMAGGKGTRLYPYTKILPKPLVPIGDTPIVERIINRFLLFGVKNFFMTVNYKKNMIKSYFNDLKKEYNLEFIEEEKPLGTGGSLTLLKQNLNTTFFLSNCDILIEANYSDIYNYHKKNKNKITMITSLKNFKIPYGVIEIDELGLITTTKEKPEYNYLVNTGMYLIEPELIELIPKDQFFNITELVDICIAKKIKVGTYPVSENSWLDMGQIDEMNKMIDVLHREDD